MQRFFVWDGIFRYSNLLRRTFQRVHRNRLWLSLIILVLAIFSGLVVPGRAKAADRQEIMEQRTENSKIFKNNDGTTSIELSGTPLHYLDEANTWQDIDTTIVTSNSTSTQNILSTFTASSTSYPQYCVTKNAYKAYFGSTLADPIRLEWKDTSIALYPQNSGASSVLVEKNSIIYADAWKDADLEYTVNPRELKEGIILKAVTAATTYSFLVKTTGITLVMETDGSIGMYDTAQGEKLWSLPSPYVVDNAAQPQFSYSAAKLILRQEGENQFIDLVVDPLWLDDPARVFPVVVDPTVLAASNTNWVSTNSVTIPYTQSVRYDWSIWVPGSMWQNQNAWVKAGTYPNGGDLFFHAEGAAGTGGTTVSGGSWFPANEGQTIYIAAYPGTYWFGFQGGTGSASITLTYRTNTRPVATPLAPPIWTNSAATLGWNFSDADSGDYQVAFQIQVIKNEPNYPLEKDSGVVYGSTSSYTFTGLSNGPKLWRVRVSDGKNWGSFAAGKGFNVDTIKPYTPSIAKNESLDGAVNVNWSEPGDYQPGSGLSTP